MTTPFTASLMSAIQRSVRSASKLVLREPTCRSPRSSLRVTSPPANTTRPARRAASGQISGLQARRLSPEGTAADPQDPSSGSPGPTSVGGDHVHEPRWTHHDRADPPIADGPAGVLGRHRQLAAGGPLGTHVHPE